VIIPAEDLKPLYDFTLDCKACEAKLSATQGDRQRNATQPSPQQKEAPSSAA
jgi:hypothetical protein